MSTSKGRHAVYLRILKKRRLAQEWVESDQSKHNRIVLVITTIAAVILSEITEWWIGLVFAVPLAAFGLKSYRVPAHVKSRRPHFRRSAAHCDLQAVATAVSRPAPTTDRAREKSLTTQLSKILATSTRPVLTRRQIYSPKSRKACSFCSSLILKSV
jgi:hypothetical protein